MFLFIILTRVYMLGIVAVWLNAISTIMFTPNLKWGRVNSLIIAVSVSPFWPLAIFSRAGREYLLLTTTEL